LTSAFKPLRVGFLGVGSIAKYHADVLNTIGHIVYAGCATSTSSTRWHEFETLAPQVIWQPTGQALLNNPNVDAIISCLPWNITETWLPELLATEKPVLIEKPIALSSVALISALPSCSSYPHNKYVGYNRRFYKTVQILKNRVAKGGVKTVEITIPENIYGLSSTYGPEIIDNILTYSSSHTLDIAVHILGKIHPVKIYGTPGTGYCKRFLSISGILETEHGCPVYLSIMGDNPAPMGIRIYFYDQTTWHLSPLERLVAYEGYEILQPTPDCQIRKYVPKPIFETIEDSRFKPGFLAQMQAFTNGDDREISATIKESMDLLQLIETIKQSIGDDV